MEEVLNILFCTEYHDETIIDEFDECQELEFVLVPPHDGEDSDKDDTASDSEGQPATVGD